jgi:hypothetical protein
MSKNTDCIVIKNKKVIDFYNQHKDIDIEKVNLLYIDLYENMMNTHNPSFISKTLETQTKDINNILTVINMHNEMYKNELNNIKSIQNLNSENIKNEIINFKSTISSLSNTINTTITNKIYETKDEYMKSVSEILNNKENNSIINFTNMIDKHNATLIDKFSLILNDIIPKENNKIHTDIIKFLKDDLKNSLDKITNSESNLTIDKFSNIIDQKYNNSIFNIQEHIMNYLALTEGRLNSHLEQLKNITNKNSALQEKVSDDFLQYLNRYKVGIIKGTNGENKLYNLISKEFSNAEIENTSGKTGMGDMILKRYNKQPILFETKEYTVNVKTDEVGKFIRDVNKNNCSGIFLSQTSGIVGKDNFQIDINGNNILIYIHHVDYDISKIKLAVNTIDFLLEKIKTMENNDIKITIDILNDINFEYKKFIQQKEKLSVDLKDFYKKTLEQYNDLNLSTLDTFLSNYFSESKKPLLQCDICGNFKAITPKSLSRHVQSCRKKNVIQDVSIKKNIKKISIKDTIEV